MVMQFLLSIVLAAVILIPTARILRRVGRHPAWCIVAIVPIVNIIGLWVFAHTAWPGVVEKQPELPTYH